MASRNSRNTRNDPTDFQPLSEDSGRNNGSNSNSTRSGCPQTWKVAVALLLVCALFLTGIVIGYLVARTGRFTHSDADRCDSHGRNNGQTQLNSATALSSGDDSVGYDDPRQLERRHWNLVDLLASMDHNLASELVDFSSAPVHSGTKHDRELHDIVYDELAALNFDDTSFEIYNTLLSFPDMQKPNFVRIFHTGNSSQNIVSEGLDGLSKHSRSLGFVGYSPSANITGELVYLNYGSVEDFSTQHAPDLSGKLALIKLGHTSVEEKVAAAAFHQMAGLLLFDDFVDIGHRQKKCGYKAPHIVLRSAGGSDPLTPGFPAVDGMWKSTPDCAKVPTLPVRTLSCHTARSILPYVRSVSNRTDGLSKNSSSTTSQQSLSVQLVVNSKLVTKPIRNIVSTIYGEKDPDHMVIIGASRSGPDAGDGLNGTSILLKFARGLSNMLHNKTNEWIPKRTIRLVSWGGADVNDMGIVEFLEKYNEVWQNSVVAYIDLDRPFETKKKTKSSPDDDSVVVLSANPSLENMIKVLASQLRENKEPTWPAVISNRQPHKINDHPIRQLFGSSYAHLQEVFDEESSSVDDASSVICQLAGLVSVTLADSGVLPLQLNRTVHDLISNVNKLIKAYALLMPNATIDAFHLAGNQLKKSAAALDTYITQHLMFQRLEDLRTVNSVIIQFDSLLGRLIHQVSSLIHRKQSYPAAAAGIGPYQTVDSSVSTDGCGDSLLSRSGASVSDDVSMLLTRMSAASRVISLNV